MTTTATTPKMPNMPILEKANQGLSVAQAAERMGVSTQTITNWIRSGELAATRFGKRIIRIDPADLDALRRPA